MSSAIITRHRRRRRRAQRHRVEPCNLYGCRLGDDVFVGPFVEIQRHVSIGARSKIQSHSFICEYVTLGKRVLSATASPSPTICSKTARPMPIRPAGAHLHRRSGVHRFRRHDPGGGDLQRRGDRRRGGRDPRHHPQGIYAGNPARLLRELP